MKTYKLVIAALVMIVTACTDLVPNDTSSLVRTSGQGFEPGNPTALLESAYKDLGVYNEAVNIYAMGVHPTTELIPPTRGTDWGDNGIWRAMDKHTWDTFHPFIRDAWNLLNERVFKATEIIASKPTPEQKAEAKFLRAFNMFNVMDFYGQVPFREVTQGVEDLPKVMTRSAAFDYIVQDLTEALPDLSMARPSPNNGKASKTAANFLLAKLYLNKAVYKSATPEGPYTFDKADMDKVITCVDAITADGYQLDADYFKVFSNTSNAETIFVSNEGTAQNRWMMALHYNQNPKGWNGFAAPANFYDKFKDGDMRKGKKGKSDGSEFSGIGLGFLLGQQYDDNKKEVIDGRSQKPLVFSRDVPLTGANTSQGIRVIKYHPANAGKYLFMRYGEAVLMKAEAQFRNGNEEQARATVNDLRAKRKAKALTTLTNDELFDEIGRELYWEGWKRTVEIRFGKFTTGEGVTDNGKHTVLYPIPYSAVVSNSNLKQNAGY